jgi:hypothetical protein
MRADWQRRLPTALVIPEIAELATLADVRSLMRHLPAETREKHTWRYVASELEKAANGSDMAEAAIALAWSWCWKVLNVAQRNRHVTAPREGLFHPMGAVGKCRPLTSTRRGSEPQPTSASTIVLNATTRCGLRCGVSTWRLRHIMAAQAHRFEPTPLGTLCSQGEPLEVRGGPTS